jgi:inactivated superfamily I helicase
VRRGAVGAGGRPRPIALSSGSCASTHADAGTGVSVVQLPKVLREAMDRESVRPPYGGHPRVAIYGLLEGRMTRATW